MFLNSLRCVELDSASVALKQFCCCLRILPVVFDIFSEIESEESIHFLWVQSESTDDMASLFCFPSRTAPAVFLTSSDNPVIATATMSSSPALANKMSPQAAAGTSSANVILKWYD